MIKLTKLFELWIPDRRFSFTSQYYYFDISKIDNLFCSLHALIIENLYLFHKIFQELFQSLPKLPTFGFSLSDSIQLTDHSLFPYHHFYVSVFLFVMFCLSYPTISSVFSPPVCPYISSRAQSSSRLTRERTVVFCI